MGDVKYMEKPLYCAFCGREKAFVDILVAGCMGACICDKCIESCDRILHDWRKRHEDGDGQ